MNGGVELELVEVVLGVWSELGDDWLDSGLPVMSLAWTRTLSSVLIW